MPNEKKGTPRKVYLCDDCDEVVRNGSGFLFSGTLTTDEGETVLTTASGKREDGLTIDPSAKFCYCKKCFVQVLKGS